MASTTTSGPTSDPCSPKPVVTYYGETHLLSTVVHKKLQTRLRSLQFSSLSSLPKEEQTQGFSDVCDGVEFIELQKLPESTGQYPRPLHTRPALHTFWTECWKQETYHSITKPRIQQWLQTLEKGGVTECAIVYCITAEVRAKRQRTLSNFATTSHVMEDMKNDFKGNELLLLRLVSSEDSRVLDSLQAFCTRISSLCRAKFQMDVEVEAELVAGRRNTACEPKELYGIFLQKLNLAVSYEMNLQNEEALQLYEEAAADLESAVSLTCCHGNQAPPTWLRALQEAPCDSWDYPKLAWHNLAWKYLPAIQVCSSPLLHTHTFLLTRIAHLHFTLERAWTVSDLVISTLHAMARQKRALKLPLPDGAFDCWAYMACNEAVLAIMSRVNPDTLVDSTSSLLLVRAQLWHYALEKLHYIGELCGLMPGNKTVEQNTSLIQTLINGISPVPFEVSSNEMVEDQGKKLRVILISKDSFKQAYLMLGEMVIGAFKHAGRRRMAFRVGTKMAKFHRDLGMMPEAEELLSDICRFYSEDQWLELSAPSYALLADCQRNLHLEDQYVNTLVLLASLPAFPSASHDPAHWMDQLLAVADKSPYQKILTFAPLLELEGVTVGEGEGGEGGGKTVKVGQKVSFKVNLKSLAPKTMNHVVVVLSLHTPSDPSSSSSQRVSVASLDPSSPRSPAHTAASSYSQLEDLDLDMEGGGLPRSRPIGQITKARTNTATLMCSSSLLELEEKSQKSLKLQMTGILPSLPPGHTTATITGQARQPGEFFLEKLSVKVGSLDFTISSPAPHGWWAEPLVITKKTEGIFISLLPTLGIFLAGYPQDCTLTFETEADVTIPQGSTVSLIMSSDVIADGDSVVEDGQRKVMRTLPEVPPSTSLLLPLHLTFPPSPSPSPSPFSSSVEKMTSTETDSTQHHQLSVLLEGVGELMKGRISVPVCQPLTLTHCEHSAGESTYLQLSLENTSPAPLLLSSPSLSVDVSTTQLHTQLPQALAPGGNFSCIWQTEPYSRSVGEDGKAIFALQYKPLIADQETSHVDLSYAFPVSNMRTVFHSQLFISGDGDTPVTAGKMAVLKYVISNVAISFPLSQLPDNLHYSISDPADLWQFHDSITGVISTPTPGMSDQICLRAVPSKAGALTPPRLTFRVPRVGSKVDFSVPSVGSKVDELECKGGEMVVLTPAQVYELSLGETVTVVVG